MNNPNHFFPQVSGSRFRSAARRALLATGVAVVLASHAGASVLFQQDFSTSSTLSDYYNDTPNNGQWNAISSSGGSFTWSITGNALQGARTGNAGAASRITDFTPTPSAAVVKWDLTVSGNSVAQTTAAVWQFGSGFGTANSAEGNINVHSRVGLNLTATDGQFSLRNIGVGDSGNFSGTQTIRWFINNSGASLTYKAPDGTDETVADDKADVWVGTTKALDEIAATTATQTLTDWKFAFEQGSAMVTMDNFLIDPVPTVPTSSAASAITSNGFTANWSAATTADGYYLDVATDSGFTSLVSGYNNLDVENVTAKAVTGLDPHTAYWYRVRAYTGNGTFSSGVSASQTLTTTYGEVAQYPLGQSPSGGWPADNAWQALSALNDANNGANQRFDFVGDTSNPCGYWAQNSSYVFFRMRVQTNSVSATTYNGLGTLWVYIDTNSDNIADCSFAWDKKSNDDANHGLEGQKLKNSGGTWNTLEMKDLDNNEETKGVEDINGNGRTGEGYVRSIDGQTTDNFGTTTFIDFAVSWAYLRTYSTTGLNTGQTWRIAFGSGDEKLDFEPPNLDVAGDANPSSSTSVGWSGSFAPTAVVLLQLQAVTVNGQVTVRWSTSSETDTAGFDLYRLVDGQWVKLNDTLIPSQGWPNGGIGASYSMADPTAKPGETYTYKLVERTTDGQSIEYGPYDRTVSPFITTTFAMTPQGFKLKWLSRTGEKYRVLKRSDLRSGQYAPIAENLAATPPENEYVDPVTTGAAFYRIELQP